MEVDDMVFGKRYRVTEHIGAGGMADVYKAVDEVLGRTVAVKVLHESYARDPEYVARFKQEAQAAANLSSPNIVNMYDWGREGENTYYIVMEYVRGTDLKSLIRSEGPLHPLDAAEYGAQVAAALSVAHGYGIIHRDIKPQNIVLTPDGQIKVMDFGIARAINTLATQTGSVLGTAQYISPEQAQGRELTPSTDLYSLGIVLYELVTGETPFEGDSPVAIALKQVNDLPVPPRKLEPDVPPELEALILKLLAKDPAARYRSADEVRGDLLRLACGQRVSAGVEAPADRTAVMPAVGGSAAGGEQQVSRQYSPKRGVSPWVWVLVVALAALLLGGIAYGIGLFEFGLHVPDVRGMTLADARSNLLSQGLAVGSVDSTSSESVIKGNVVSTDPAAGAEAKRGAKVDLVVSSGPPLVKVPDLVGLTQDEAIAAIQDKGFVVGTPSEKTSTKYDAGIVFAQNPLADTDAVKGSAIDFTVSLGPKEVGVPYVVDLKQAQAISKLEDAGFRVKPVKKSSEDTPKGFVITQSPAGGSVAPEGSTVVITVSTGPPLITVPTVTTMTQAEAENALAAAEFLVDVQPGSPAPDPASVGRVESQSPAGGEKAPKGSTVVIKIYQP